MSLKEFPHHRACFEVSDTELRSAPGTAPRVFRPTMTHSRDCAERNFVSVSAALISYASGRALVVRLDGRTVAPVAVCPAGDVWLGARIGHCLIRGTVHIEDGE